MVNPNTLWIMLHAKGRPPRAWINPSPLSLRAKKLNRISLLILQAKKQNFLQQNNSQPKTQHAFRMEKDGGILEHAI
jgi:hypothetical protein